MKELNADNNTLHIIRRFCKQANKMRPAFTETPVFAIQAMTYIALHQDEYLIYAEELISELNVKPDKLYRSLRNNLRDYVKATPSKKEGVRGPVTSYTLTPKGRKYLMELAEILEE